MTSEPAFNPGALNSRHRSFSVCLDGATADRLRRLAKQSGETHAQLLREAVQIVLDRLEGDPRRADREARERAERAEVIKVMVEQAREARLARQRLIRKRSLIGCAQKQSQENSKNL